MRRFCLVGGSMAVMACVGLFVACTGDPASKVPTSPSSPSVSTLQVTGPATVAPGQTAQFAATLNLSTATSKSASPATGVRWFSSNTSLLRVDASGLATALQQTGDATVTGQLTVQGGTRTATREITVLPDGTYRMVGRVTDSTSQVPVLSARIEVTPGPPFVNTDFTGQYKMYGVPANTDVKVTANGYQPFVQSLHLTANAAQDFQLTPTGPPLNLTGPYTLAIDVTDGCASSLLPLPTNLQHRSYDAVATPTGPTSVDVTLTEPRFRVNSLGLGNRFSGQVSPVGASFNLGGLSGGFYYYYYYSYDGPTGYPNIVERLSDGTFLVVHGLVTTTATSTGVSGPLNGRVTNWDPRFPTTLVRLGGCLSSQFTLTRR